MLRAVATGLAAGALLSSVAARADGERWISIRETEYRVVDDDRVAEIEAADPEAVRARKLVELVMAGSSAESERISAELRSLQPKEDLPDRVERDRERRLWDATRGIDPRLVIECVVAEGRAVNATVWDAEAGRNFVRPYRVERILDAAEVLLAIGERVAEPHPIGRPELIRQTGSHGATMNWKLVFLELRPVERPRRTDTCEVRYAPAIAPR